jgi:hypothetical protein
VRVLLAVSKQDRNEVVAIWVPNQIFDKSDREGDVSQERSPFRFTFTSASCAAPPSVPVKLHRPTSMARSILGGGINI